MKILVKNYQKLLEELKSEQRLLLPGYLIIRGQRYYHRLNGCDRGITRQTEKIIQLARQKYIDVLITIITNYLAAPLSDIHNFRFSTHAEIIASLPNAYQNLPDHYFYQTSLKSWLQQPIPPPHHEEDLHYPTKAGYFVRSKEEVLISDTLTDNNIPHLYELPYRSGNFITRPDFTIKNPYTGTTSVWEHHGAFHLKQYGEKAHKKILSYTKSGLIVNDTLIITYADDITIPGRLQEIIDTTMLKI